MNKIKIVFNTGEVIRFLGCGVRLDGEKIAIKCGRYLFKYDFSEIKNFYVKGFIDNEKEIKAEDIRLG